MASRAATAPDDLDYFPTPPWAARAGGELIQRIDPGPWTCWEPAAGGGHMAHGLRDDFASVYETDVHDYGGEAYAPLDFLTEPDAGRQHADWIVTNPPFKAGEAFVRQGWRLARRGVAMLLRMAFLETIGRYKLFYQDCPLTVLAPFAERVPMVKGRWDPQASSATAYAWFVFVKTEADPRLALAYGGAPRVIPIPPGTKARLTRPSDFRRFAPKPEAAGLLGELHDASEAERAPLAGASLGVEAPPRPFGSHGDEREGGGSLAAKPEAPARGERRPAPPAPAQIERRSAHPPDS